ncbi:hypothetical protein DERF_003232 [Dermatophagoides farinae]|uniref:Uncharacterized protein n=1 Tax=Dermatophagoides farinae TaxID=6954 RepID=A0A922IC72_DERFA|nr:hypothetical protein DERF_003232 [Dermatophagoides farinae]
MKVGNKSKRLVYTSGNRPGGSRKNFFCYSMHNRIDSVKTMQFTAYFLYFTKGLMVAIMLSIKDYNSSLNEKK